MDSYPSLERITVYTSSLKNRFHYDVLLVAICFPPKRTEIINQLIIIVTPPVSTVSGGDRCKNTAVFDESLIFGPYRDFTPYFGCVIIVMSHISMRFYF